MTDFKVKIRDELQDDYRVFYVTSWGYAGDHLIGWFPKALNCHHELFALLAHEGSRPKYLAERTRAERPPLVTFTEFLNDMGMTYAAIGDCYSYRAGQMPELLDIERYSDIPVLNLVRHPVVWLEFYVNWRSSNMRMREGATDPLAWEWKTACHGYFDYLGLPAYTRDEVETWAAYQGMFQLNNVLGDIRAVKKHLAVEEIADKPELFSDSVKYLTRGRVEFDPATLNIAYSMRDTLFRGEASVETDPDRLFERWPGWKVDAFRRIVSKDAVNAYCSFGYRLDEALKRPLPVKKDRSKPPRSIFVSSLPKSGTWLLREMLVMITGLEPYEPDVGEGFPAYDDEMLIEFPPGKFFTWHSILTSRTAALLNGCQSKNIFLVRNIYNIILSMFNHLKYDVDEGIGRSVKGSHYFDDKTMEQCLTLMISGFTTAELTWMGAAPILKQLDSLLAYMDSGTALLLEYDNLTASKRKNIRRIARFLDIDVSESRVREILDYTDKDSMRERLKASNLDRHVSDSGGAVSTRVFQQYHRQMLDSLILANTPALPGRLRKHNLEWILNPNAEERDTSGWQRFKKGVRKTTSLARRR